MAAPQEPHHYDVGVDFYRLWLDPSLTYSCALWEDGDDDLESAQQHKIDLLVNLAHAQGVRRVLDIGCGWGSVLRRLVAVHDVYSAIGLTPSSDQVKWIAAFDEPRVEVRNETWEAHRCVEPYDAILSIGSFEHFAPPGVVRSYRPSYYRAFFERCHEMLVSGGALALQTIAVGDARLDREALMDMVFISREVFPGSSLPRLREIVDACHGLFELESVRNDRNHYARTCSAWLENLRWSREAAVASVGEGVVARYERFLRASSRMFERGHANLLRMGLARVG
jgi:cyclopropane-fatty-acyl-phospholipid synthase